MWISEARHRERPQGAWRSRIYKMKIFIPRSLLLEKQFKGFDRINQPTEDSSLQSAPVFLLDPDLIRFSRDIAFSIVSNVSK